MSKILTIGIVLFLTLVVNSQISVKLKIETNNFEQAYFCSVYGEKLNVISTNKFIGDSVFFRFNNNIPKGMYKIVLGDTTQLEILIDNDSEIILTSKYPNIKGNIKILKGLENSRYYNFNNYKNTQIKTLNTFIEKINTKNPNTQTSEKIGFAKGVVSYKLKQYSDSLISINPKLFVSKLIKSSLIPDVNYYTISNLTTKTYNNDIEYLMTHFFDNIDFTDSLMLRTDIIYKTINTYIEKIVLPRNTTGFNYANEFIINKAKANETVYNYVISMLLNLYGKTSLEDVYAKLYNDYVLKTPNVLNTAEFEEVSKKIKIITDLKQGSIAHDFSCLDTAGNTIKLSSIKSNFNILIFYKSDTKNILKTIKQLNDIYLKYKSFGIDVFAVSLDNDSKQWKTFLNSTKTDYKNFIIKPDYKTFIEKNYTTWALPSIYILDANTKIAYKPINIDYVKKECEKVFSGN